MTLKRVGEPGVQYLYLRDTFLERYEQNSIYDTVPGRTPDGQWMCSPSYGGQWSFVGCQRIGRNLVRVEVYNLYKKAIPEREILHAHAHAVRPEVVAHMLADEEHVAAKTQRLLDQLIVFGDNLSALGDMVGAPHKAGAELVGFSREDVEANGWHGYRMLWKLAQVAPLEMTQAAFLARCKTLNEILQKALPNTYLKSVLRAAGCTNSDLAKLQSLKLLQALINIIDHLLENRTDVASFDGAATETDWRAENDIMTPLFINYDLRIADAHEGNEWLLRLEQLGFDTAHVNDGHGRALDFVMDRVIESLRSMNVRLKALLLR